MTNALKVDTAFNGFNGHNVAQTLATYAFDSVLRFMGGIYTRWKFQQITIKLIKPLNFSIKQTIKHY